MLSSLVHRLAYAGALMFVVSVAAFALLRLMPGSVAEVLLMAQMDGHIPTEAALARFSADHGFDDPLALQYLRWLNALLHGDLGVSLITGQPVAAEILRRLVNSLIIAALSLMVAVAVALPMAVLAARHPNGVLDRLCGAVAMLGMSIPNFWYGLLMALLFALVLGWLPSSGSGSWQHAVMPTLVVGTSIAGVMTRYIRGLLLEESGRPYMRTATAKGVSPLSALLRHALPNAVPAMLTLAGLQFVRIFDGVIVVETVFAWPGIGRYLVDAVMNRDYPVVQACFMAIALAYILTNLIVDLAITAVNPRMREAV